MKTLTLAALAMSLCAASPAYAEKPTDPQTELIVNLAVCSRAYDDDPPAQPQAAEVEVSLQMRETPEQVLKWLSCGIHRRRLYKRRHNPCIQ